MASGRCRKQGRIIVAFILINNKRIMKTSFLVLFFATSAFIAYGQTFNVGSSKVKWIADSFMDLTSVERVSQYSYFVTNNRSDIEWVQGDSVQYKMMLKVHDTKGRWTDVRKDGNITFVISMDTHEGILVIQRTNNALSIVVEIMGVEGGDIKMQYSIAEYSELP